MSWRKFLYWTLLWSFIFPWGAGKIKEIQSNPAVKAPTLIGCPRRPLRQLGLRDVVFSQISLGKKTTCTRGPHLYFEVISLGRLPKRGLTVYFLAHIQVSQIETDQGVRFSSQFWSSGVYALFANLLYKLPANFSTAQYIGHTPCHMYQHHNTQSPDSYSAGLFQPCYYNYYMYYLISGA